MAWPVLFHADFAGEFESLPDAVKEELLAQAKVLETFGPALGRPRADTLKGSKHANMKELRFGAADGVWRVACQHREDEEVIMPKTLNEMMERLSAERRAKVHARAKALIAEEMALAELRRAKALTQKKMAVTLGIGQEGVSRLEKRSDLLISTLRDYIEAMGGRLRLIADFPDRPPVEVSGLAAIEAAKKKVTRRVRSGARR
jgi:DNA-binding XRE family transcriptional regulator